MRRVGDAYFVCPADWEQLRHEEGGAGRPVPYWARPWPSGVRRWRAQLKDDPPAPGTRVIELGCGLALPSVVAARAGAQVLATDGASDAVAFAAHVLALNEVEGDVACADWAEHGERARRARAVRPRAGRRRALHAAPTSKTALRLFPRLVAPGGELRVADPNRAGAQGFLSAARAFFHLVSERGPDVSLHTLRPRNG